METMVGNGLSQLQKAKVHAQSRLVARENRKDTRLVLAECGMSKESIMMMTDEECETEYNEIYDPEVD